MDFIFHVRLPAYCTYPTDDFETDWALFKAQNANKYCFDACEDEIIRREKRGIWDLVSYGIFINDLIKPFYFRFYHGAAAAELIVGLRLKYLKYVNMMHLLENGHYQWYSEVVKYGFIQSINDQKKWNKHWRHIVEYYENLHQFSAAILKLN